MDASVRSRLSRVDRMEQTLAAAHDLFGERGYAEVTMEEIAAEVGVTKPLLYNYFGNKERLYIACMERAGDALTTTVDKAVAATRSPGEALGAGVHAFFAFLDTDRGAWAVLFDETLPNHGEVADRVADYRRRITGLVAGSLLTQLPQQRRQAARVEIEALSVALLGAAEALARWWLRTEAVSAEEAAELLVSTIEPGLRARSAVSFDGEPDADASPPPSKSTGKGKTEK
jgi:AcrR family transcriptional regulator